MNFSIQGAEYNPVFHYILVSTLLTYYILNR